MKNLLLGATVLLMFSVSLLIIQTSCSKTTAQLNNALSQANKIIFVTNWPDVGGGQIWTCNYDGTNLTQISVTFPAGVLLNYDKETRRIFVSPDGQTMFVTGINPTTNEVGIYSCSVNGGNATLVYQQVSTTRVGPFFCVAY